MSLCCPIPTADEGQGEEMLYYAPTHNSSLDGQGQESGMSSRSWGNDARNGRGEEGRDTEDRAELEVRHLRENCYVTIPLNKRCASATQRAVRHHVFRPLISIR